MSGEYVEISYDRLVHSTDNAVLFEFGNGSQQWIPRSVIDDDVDDLTSGPGEVSVAEWFVMKEGLDLWA